ncbi:MAG: hypothetical protein ACMG6E_03395 [Candidatus Roizmanbacteria bacterium]
MFQQYKWHYLIIAIVILIILYIVIVIQLQEIYSNRTKHGSGSGSGESQYWGRGDPSEDEAVLLDRIQWSTYLNKRIHTWARIFIGTLIATIIIIILVYKRWPPPKDIIMIMVAIFIPFLATHSFLYVHADAYNDYYIKTNAKYLREKLGLRRYEDPPKPLVDTPDRPLIM